MRPLDKPDRPGFKVESTRGNPPAGKVSHAKPIGATIVIADDEPIFRDGLSRLLESELGVHVVGQAGDGEGAVRLVSELKPDILLLDLAMPRFTGLDALHELARSSMPVRTIVLTADVKTFEMVQAFQLGAWGVVLKKSASSVLFDCIHRVLDGEYWVESEKVSDLVQAVRSLASNHSAGSRRTTFGLTPRELEVIALVVSGCSNKDIAKEFSISEHTVKNHLTNILDKTGASNRLELALFALEHRLTNNFSRQLDRSFKSDSRNARGSPE